jgi:hypothetical protein
VESDRHEIIDRYILRTHREEEVTVEQGVSRLKSMEGGKRAIANRIRVPMVGLFHERLELTRSLVSACLRDFSLFRGTDVNAAAGGQPITLRPEEWGHARRRIRLKETMISFASLGFYRSRVWSLSATIWVCSGFGFGLVLG